jgi:hypothetical protein
LSGTSHAQDAERFAEPLPCPRNACPKNLHMLCAFMYARHDRCELLKAKGGCEGCWGRACGIWRELKVQADIHEVASIWQGVCSDTFEEFHNAASSGPVRGKVITIDDGDIIHAAATRFDAPASMPGPAAARFEHTGNVSESFMCAFAPCNSNESLRMNFAPGCTYTLDEAKLRHLEQHHCIFRLSHVCGKFAPLCDAVCLSIPCEPS